MGSDPKSNPAGPVAPEPAKKKKIDLVLPILNEEIESTEQEMEDLFNEDKVEHRHGDSEPEHD
jgi:hypothetical protein